MVVALTAETWIRVGGCERFYAESSPFDIVKSSQLDLEQCHHRSKTKTRHENNCCRTSFISK